MSNFISCIPSLPSLTSSIMQMTTYPKLHKKQLINRPTDLGAPNLQKELIRFYTKLTDIRNQIILMKKSTMKKYLDLFFDTNANEYISQLTHQQMKGFIKKFMNVLTQKNNKYRATIGCILGGWVRRLRPKYFEMYHIDIFHGIPIEENLREIRNSSKHFKNVFIALEQQRHVIPS